MVKRLPSLLLPLPELRVCADVYSKLHSAILALPLDEAAAVPRTKSPFTHSFTHLLGVCVCANVYCAFFA